MIGIDQIALPGKDGEPAEMPCLTVVQYRVKVLIPTPRVWMEEQDAFVMNGMIGTKIDYIVQGVDREGEWPWCPARLRWSSSNGMRTTSVISRRAIL